MERRLDFPERGTRAVPARMTTAIFCVIFLTAAFDMEDRYAARSMQSLDPAQRMAQELQFDGHSTESKAPTEIELLAEKYMTLGSNDTEANEDLHVLANVTDIAGSYVGNWCMKEKNATATLFPKLVQSDCGKATVKMRSMGLRENGKKYAMGTVILHEESAANSLSFRFNGEFQIDKAALLMLNWGTDMYMRPDPLGEDEARDYAPYGYIPCKVRTFMRAERRRPAEAVNATSQASPANETRIEMLRQHTELPLIGSIESAYDTDGEGRPLTLKGVIESENCMWHVELSMAKISMARTINKVTRYSFMMGVVAVAQIFCLTWQIERPPSPEVSLLSLGHQAMMDAYLCLIHVTGCIVAETLFGWLSTVATLEFVVFSMFEMRYLIHCSHSRLEQNWFVNARGDGVPDVGGIYGRFYGLLVMGIIILYQVKDNHYLLSFIFFSYWLPQIVRNAVYGYRHALKPRYIVGMTLSRLCLPLYLYGCPENFLKVPYNPNLCLAIVAYSGAQVGLLLLQYHKGSRYFIPAMFLPKVYNYFRALDSAHSTDLRAKVQEEGGLDCVICMTPVDYQIPSSRMVTPCNHFFHRECLERWLKVKLECPTCRRALPAMEC